MLSDIHKSITSRQLLVTRLESLGRDVQQTDGELPPALFTSASEGTLQNFLTSRQTLQILWLHYGKQVQL